MNTIDTHSRWWDEKEEKSSLSRLGSPPDGQNGIELKGEKEEDEEDEEEDSIITFVLFSPF